MIKNINGHINKLKKTRDKGFKRVVLAIQYFYKNILEKTVAEKELELYCRACILSVYLILIERSYEYQKNDVFHDSFLEKINDLSNKIKKDNSLEYCIQNLHETLDQRLIYINDASLLKSPRAAAYISMYKSHDIVSKIYHVWSFQENKKYLEYEEFSSRIDTLLENKAFQYIFPFVISYIEQRIALVEFINKKGAISTTLEFISAVKYIIISHNHYKGFDRSTSLIGENSSSKNNKNLSISKTKIKKENRKKMWLKVNDFLYLDVKNIVVSIMLINTSIQKLLAQKIVLSIANVNSYFREIKSYINSH